MIGARGLSTRVGAHTPPSPTAYRARRGPAPNLKTRRGGRRRQRKQKKNLRTFVLVIAIAFIFLFTPAQERIEAQLGKWMDQLMEEFGGYREYPVSVSYSVERHVVLDNQHIHNDATFTYRLPIPEDRTERGVIGSSGFELDIGTTIQPISLQSISYMSVRTSNSQTTIDIPVQTQEVRLADDAISIDANSEVFWPNIQSDGGLDRCNVTRCVIWRGTLPPGTSDTLIVRYDVVGYSFTWHGSDVPSKVPKSSDSGGFDMFESNSGTFADLDRSGYLGAMKTSIGDHPQWYDRDPGSGVNWAIDGNHPIVVELANEIEASLPADKQDNVYAFAHAAYIHVYNEIIYDTGLSGNARSGPQCIADGRGDCDEQSNAWMSILRTRGISSWYEFGPMTDANFNSWEPHAWANVLLPLDSDYCTTNGIEISSCYVEASVDVVNNKWLLHTPTSFTQWIEQPSGDGDGAYKFYRPLSSNGPSGMWAEVWNTIGVPQITGGLYQIPAWVE